MFHLFLRVEKSLFLLEIYFYRQTIVDGQMFKQQMQPRPAVSIADRLRCFLNIGQLLLKPFTTGGFL